MNHISSGGIELSASDLSMDEWSAIGDELSLPSQEPTLPGSQPTGGK